MSSYNKLPIQYYPYMQESSYIEENNNSSPLKFIIVGLCIFGLLYIIFFKDSGGASAGGTTAGGAPAGGTTAGGTTAGGTSAGGTSAGDVPQYRFKVPSDRWYSKPFQSITKDMETCQSKWGTNNCEIINYGLSRAAIHKCSLQAKEKGISDITNWKGIARAGNGLKNPYCVNQITAPYPEYELDPTASDTPQTYKDWYKKITTPVAT